MRCRSGEGGTEAQVRCATFGAATVLDGLPPSGSKAQFATLAWVRALGKTLGPTGGQTGPETQEIQRLQSWRPLQAKRAPNRWRCPVWMGTQGTGFGVCSPRQARDRRLPKGPEEPDLPSPERRQTGGGQNRRFDLSSGPGGGMVGADLRGATSVHAAGLTVRPPAAAARVRLAGPGGPGTCNYGSTRGQEYKNGHFPSQSMGPSKWIATVDAHPLLS